MMNEQCWVLVGTYAESDQAWLVKKQRQVSGGPASVEVDWAWTLAREERYSDVIGFLHTHLPGMGAIPSARDVRTMRAWCSALGKPLLCLIEDRERLDGYVFTDDESEGRPVKSIGQVKPGQFVVNG